jgi:hypothetical protein
MHTLAPFHDPSHCVEGVLLHSIHTLGYSVPCAAPACSRATWWRGGEVARLHAGAGVSHPQSAAVLLSRRLEWKAGKIGKSGNHDRKSCIYSVASLHPRPIFFHTSAILTPHSFPPPPENPYPTSLPWQLKRKLLTGLRGPQWRRGDTTRGEGGGKGRSQ